VRFLIDECLHQSLVVVAHTTGFEATHVNYLGLSGYPDWALAERILEDEYTFVTNNRVDFIRLFQRIEIHTGLIILVPNLVPALQRVLFQAALEYASTGDLVNNVMEVVLEGNTVVCTVYKLPGPSK
jgi:predicted nuclease of predicted toxin-antitoxin system